MYTHEEINSHNYPLFIFIPPLIALHFHLLFYYSGIIRDVLHMNPHAFCNFSYDAFSLSCLYQVRFHRRHLCMCRCLGFLRL